MDVILQRFWCEMKLDDTRSVNAESIRVNNVDVPCQSLSQIHGISTAISRSEISDVPALTTPFESPLQSSPPRASFTAAATSVATVPLLALGINPFGPSNLANAGFLPNNPNNSGVVMSLSITNLPLNISSINSSAPTLSAPAARAAMAAGPEAKTTR